MQFNETIDRLYALQWHGIKLGLDNPIKLLGRLHNPQSGMRFAHIAGTNGKGSTARMLSSILTATGRRVGLFTSPHLLSFTERISIDGVQVSEEQVVELAREVLDASEGMAPTFFEVVTAMAFLHFSRNRVDCAVIETGLGGRLDATNVINPEVTVITPIGLDHAEFLGNTIREVATEKAGIIKTGSRLVCAGQHPQAMEIIEHTASELGAPMTIAGREFGAVNIERDLDGVLFGYQCGVGTITRLRIPLMGEYQAHNAALAVRAYEAMTNTLDEDAIREGLKHASWPGRLELVADDPPVFIDGAHNAPAADALARELTGQGYSGMMTLVLGVMQDKDAAGIIGPLLPLGKQVIFTRAAYGRAASPVALALQAREMGFSGTFHEVQCVADAIGEARAMGSPVLVAGSFYTAGEALEALGRKSVLGTLRESGPAQ